MLKIIFYKILFFLSKFVQIQLFIIIISLPILIAWGLPISKLSLLGNLIFLPFLTMFLILSSLLFFTQILNIPNDRLIYCFEKLVQLWQYFLNLSFDSWLFGFSEPNFLFLILIPLVVLIILSNDYLNRFAYRRIVAFISLIFFINFYFFYNDFCSKNITLCSGKNKLLISRNPEGNIFLYDFNFLKSKRGLGNFLEYELKPYILKNFGRIKIQDLIFVKPNKRDFLIKKEFFKVFNRP
ncbi:hypothetical protein GF322_03355 [Candidatus Dependentiae bacterium]|nr:hypothetical protein [Candidatus Dependentiae bacterium]